MVYMYHGLLIHSSADGHLGCFHVLAMINRAVMKHSSFSIVFIYLTQSSDYPQGTDTL